MRTLRGRGLALTRGESALMGSYSFLPEIPMDREHSLEQMTSGLRGLRDGLPELVKNAKDQYARLGIADRESRQIVVLADSKRRLLGVLDFAGATSAEFAGWQTWSSRTASRTGLSPDIEAGHGNGGKAFMVQGCDTEAYMLSCSGGLVTKMGFDNVTPGRRFIPGYGLDSQGREMRDLAEKNPRQRLTEALSDFGITPVQIPSAAQAAFKQRNAFTIVRLDGVRDLDGTRSGTNRRVLDERLHALSSHPQASITIESSQVWLIIDGKLAPGGPLEVLYPAPLEGLEKIPKIPIPASLSDPVSGASVSTGEGNEDEKYLLLRTSQKHLRMTESKALNAIRVRNARNIVAVWSVADLHPRAESAFLFGDLRVPALAGEYLAGSERRDLADTPLARALKEWTTEQIAELAQRIQQAAMKDHRPQDVDKANDALEQMRRLMREFLKADGPSGESPTDRPDGRGGGGGANPIPPIVFGTRVDEVLFESEGAALSLASGTVIPAVIRCYERAPDGKRLPVPSAKVSLEADKSGVVHLEADRMLRGLSEGTTTARIRATGTSVVSNPIAIEVVACRGVDIIAPERTLLQGERVKVTCSFHATRGHRQDLLVEGSVDDTTFGRVSRAAIFSAGRVPGIATLRIRFGSRKGDQASAQVEIGREAVPPPERGAHLGSDVPIILLCGTPAPGREELPPDQRTHYGGEIHQTIIMDEPQFENIVWINPDSKESQRVRRARGGSGGVGSIRTKSFLEFVALKCFEVLKRLKVNQEVGAKQITVMEFGLALSRAELDCAGFIDAAYAIAESLQQDRTAP